MNVMELAGIFTWYQELSLFLIIHFIYESNASKNCYYHGRKCQKRNLGLNDRVFQREFTWVVLWASWVRVRLGCITCRAG